MTPTPNQSTWSEELKPILEQLTANAGEEYMKLHTGKQDFKLTNGRMSFYENQAIEAITALVERRVIGEDEAVYGTEVKRNNKSVRDYLRAEQRAIIRGEKS